MKLVKKNWLLTAAVSASLAGLAGCNNDNDNDNDIFDKQVKLLVADDQGGNVGSISQYQFSSNSGPGSVERVVNANLAEGIEKDAVGNLYQAGNLASGEGAVQAMCSPAMRTSPVAISANRDRLITSALTSPKGIAIAQKAGYMIIAQSGDETDAVSVFGTTAANADTAMFSIPRAMVGDSSAWDVVYDEDSDQLFVALTNGDVAYYNDFLSRSADGDYTPTATFNPDNALAATNMHGIVYDAAADRLIVSDVADPTSADDGSIYVFETASMLSGAVTPDRTIRGAATHLGNPVDLQLNDGDLYVAEKANESGRIMVFNDIATGASGNIAPDADYLVAGPESIVTETVGQMIGNDVSDLSNATVGSLHITSNAANTGTSVYMTDPALTSMGTIFTPVQGTQYVESISLDQNGDAIISFDDAGAASGSGLSFISRLAMRDAAGSYTDQRDRQITGASTNLSAPKGVEVVGSYGLVLVADLSATNAIKAFSLCGDGNAAPVFETTMPAGTSPWDLDYDPEADRLYVAATNGTIQVYDDYMANPDAAPARIIDPNDQSGIEASNIHGIVHDSVNDRLIVSDVGSATDATDGRIYVIDNASTANGPWDLRLELAGYNTALGNPVDLAFDGTNLYVAEKSNNQIQRIDNIYALEGVMNRAPDKMMTFTAPESIAISAQ